ncbi:hypothetical protein ACA910_005954 [Epithemia clementina (nom. ined.)]
MDQSKLSSADASKDENAPESMDSAETMGSNSGSNTPSQNNPNVKPALKKEDMANEKKDKHLKWDEKAIEEHDQLRGTRMKIDEPNTPFAQYDSGAESDSSRAKSPAQQRVTLSWDVLQTRLDSVAAVRLAYPSSPGSSHAGDQSDEEERKKEMRRLEFKEHRKRHYNEMELVRKYKEENLDDDGDEMNFGSNSGSNTPSRYNPKPALKKDDDFGNEKKDRHLKWDEKAIEEHDQLRGTRMKIDEPKTPFTQYDSGAESDGSARPKSPAHQRVTLSWDVLQTKLDSVAAVRSAYPSSPGSSHAGEADQSDAEEEWKKEERRLEFKELRKRHYNEMEAVRRFRQEHAEDGNVNVNDDDDDDDSNDGDDDDDGDADVEDDDEDD